MSFTDKSPKPHALCIPLPYQSHMKAMLKLAKLLYTKGFQITFLNSDWNQSRLLQSGGARSLDGLPDFRFEAIPVGFVPEGYDHANDDVPSLCHTSLRRLVARLNDEGLCDGAPVTCIVSDGYVTFPIEVGEEFGIPVALFFTTAACSYIPFVYYDEFVDKGLLPPKDESYQTNAFLDIVIDWIPGLNPIRIRDLPSNMTRPDPDHKAMLKYCLRSSKKSPKASAILFHTFDALEPNALHSLRLTYPAQVLGIGPIQPLLNKHIATIPQQAQKTLKSIDCNLWAEEAQCLRWLGSMDPGSVIYANFGSIASLTPVELVEFGWGLANSNHPFLWAIRPDLVTGGSAILPPEFAEAVRGRSFLTSWCPQEEVLAHPSVGAFLTHCGWSSIIESLSSGVPMMCWPFFGDQSTNSWLLCGELGVGVEMNRDVERGEVERVVREVMDGKRGKEMKEMALEWKTKCEDAIGENGSSSLALDKLIDQVLLSKYHI